MLEFDGGNDVTTTKGDVGEALAQHLLTKGYPLGWRALKMAMYEGLTDSEDHLHSFRTGMEDMTGRMDFLFRMFQRMLKKEAVGWYRRLPVLEPTH